MSQPGGQQTSRNLTQSKEALLISYNKRLKDDTKSMVENFVEIVKLAKVEEESQVGRATLAEQNHYEMQVRSNNMIRAGESLLKLVSDIKEFLILNDFPSVNDAIQTQRTKLRAEQRECDQKLLALRDEMAEDLYELEQEYYSSVCK